MSIKKVFLLVVTFIFILESSLHCEAGCLCALRALSSAEKEQDESLGQAMAQILAKVVYANIEPASRKLVVTYPGAPISSLLLSLSDTNLLNVVRVAPNEFIATDVAFGLARLNGIAVIAVTHGAGTKPVLAEVGKFMNEGLPLIILTGGRSFNDQSIDGMHALTNPADLVSKSDEDIKIARAMGIEVFELSKFSTITSQQSLAAQFQEAVVFAMRNRKPVLVVVEPGISEMRTTQPLPLRDSIESKLSAADQQYYTDLAHVVFEKLNGSQQPVLYVGEGLPSQLVNLVETISEESGILTTVTLGAKGLIKEDLPTYGGIYQGAVTVWLPRTKQYVETSDFVLRIGNRIIPLVIEEGVDSRKFPRNTVTIPPLNRYPCGQHMECFLQELLRYSRAIGWRRRNLDSTLQLRSQVMPDNIEAMRTELISRNTLNRVLSYYNLKMPHECPFMYVVDRGTSWFVASYMATKGSQALLSNWTYGELGVAVGQAMAVALATDKMPIVLIGDGGYNQKGITLLPDLVSSKRHVVFVVFDNKLLRMGMPKGISQEAAHNIYETASGLDIAKVAQAQGAKAYTVTKNGELLDALRMAERKEGVHVIVVPVEDNEVDMPEPLRMLSERLAAQQDSISGTSQGSGIPYRVHDMRVGITGGSGSLGAPFIRWLLNRKNVQINTISRAPNSSQVQERIPGNIGRIKVERACLFDVNELNQLFEDSDVVYHIGGWVRGRQPIATAAEAMALNSLSTALIVKLAQKHGKRLIFASSGSVYLNNDILQPYFFEENLILSPDVELFVNKAVAYLGQVDESMFGESGGSNERIAIEFLERFLKINPVPDSVRDLYGLTKIIAERVVAKYSQGVSLRIWHAYGRGDETDRRLPLLIKKITEHSGEPVEVKRDEIAFCHIDTVLSALESAALYPLTLDNRIINVAGSELIDLPTAAKLIKQATDSPAVIRIVPQSDLPTLILDIRLMKTALGILPDKLFSEGIVENCVWLQDPQRWNRRKYWQITLDLDLQRLLQSELLIEANNQI